MHDRNKLRQLLFHDPQGHIARLVIPENPPEERLLAAYQSLTVLARLVWERPFDPKLAGRLHRITCPVLLIWGGNDRLVPPAHGDAYRKHLPHAELKKIPNCGHLPMFEQETDFVQAVSQFVSVSV